MNKKSKVIAIFLAILIAVLPLTVQNAEAFTFRLNSQYYYFESVVDPGKVLDISGGSKDDGANLQL